MIATLQPTARSALVTLATALVARSVRVGPAAVTDDRQPACAGDGSGAEPPAPVKPQAPPTKSPNPPANVNLQGFPLPYRQGYADGCASIGSVEHKDPARFKNDGQYRTGWQDGNFLCKKK